MKSNRILMAGALALSMILSGCSATSTSEDVKDAKATETAKKADSKKSTKEDAKTSTKDKKESPKTETNKNTAEAVETKETSNSEIKKVEVQTQNSQQHTHNWVAQTQTIHHDAVYETKYVVDQPAYDELPDWKDVDGYICDNCHQEMFTLEEAQMHVQVSAAMGSGKCKSYHAGIVRIPPGAENLIHHDEVGHNEQVLVQDAWDETVNNGYKCSICGATK